MGIDRQAGGGNFAAGAGRRHRDTGGSAGEDLERFYQVDPSRSGAGLGLSLVWQIAQIHGGYMTLESIPDAGSAFTLHLPDAEDPCGGEKT